MIVLWCCGGEVDGVGGRLSAALLYLAWNPGRWHVVSSPVHPPVQRWLVNEHLGLRYWPVRFSGLKHHFSHLYTDSRLKETRWALKNHIPVFSRSVKPLQGKSRSNPHGNLVFSPWKTSGYEVCCLEALNPVAKSFWIESQGSWLSLVSPTSVPGKSVSDASLLRYITSITSLAVCCFSAGYPAYSREAR